VDEYSKSGPKTPMAASREREQGPRRIIERLLEIENEQDFVEELRKRRITPEFPAYKDALNAWREKHPVR